VVDFSGLLPDEIIQCFKMIRDGREGPEIAEYFKTDTSHFLQNVRRVIEKLSPSDAALLNDRMNHAVFTSRAFAEELETITSRMRARRIAKLLHIGGRKKQKPDATRASPTGHNGSHRLVRLNNFNEKVCGNSDFDDTNNM
jgi:hypothetical protein